MGNIAEAERAHGGWQPQSRRFQVLGPEPTAPCAHCGVNDGKVYLIRKNFGPNPAAVPLHEEHAREYFEAAAKAAPPPRASAAQAPITAEEMDELRRRGFSGDDLFDMNPKRAREIIADPRYERMGERFRVGAKTAEPCHVCLERGAKMITCIASGETVALHLKCAPLYDEATGAPPVED